MNKTDFPLFDDVFGLDNTKDDLKNIVSFIKKYGHHEPESFILPKGLLFYGQPGTGKTFLAKAFSNELNMECKIITSESFKHYVSFLSENLLTDEKDDVPKIIFIDEIDSILGLNSFGDTEANKLNTLLNLLDGVNGYNNHIIIAATNKVESLPNSLLRAGRFDRKYHLELPGFNAIQKAINVLFDSYKFKKPEDITAIVQSFIGMTIAEVNTIMKEVILENHECDNPITSSNVIKSIEKYYAGLYSDLQTTNQQILQHIAVHEAAHAFVMQHLKGIDQLMVVSVNAHAKSAGHVMENITHENDFKTKSQLENDVMILLSGYVAEKYFFKENSVGAAKDLEKATYIVTRMVEYYGMTNLPPRSYNPGTMDTPIYIGEKLKSKTDRKVNQYVKKLHNRTWKTVKKYEKQIKDFSKVLAKKKTMVKKEVVDIILS